MITVAQVTQASELELVRMTYQLFLETVQDAMDEEDTIIRKKLVQRARDILKILVNNLDFEVPMAGDLFDLYVYVQKLLVSRDGLPEAFNLISIIKDGYDSLPDDERPRAVANAQNIYAGMTYSGNQLNEVIVENSNRGFRA